MSIFLTRLSGFTEHIYSTRVFSAYFGKRSLVILGIFIDKNAQFGNFYIDKMVHFGKILCTLILLNQLIFLYQYSEINTSYSPCER